MLCKAPTRSCSWITDDKCLPIIRAVNDVTNPKVESLTRGDQIYNDPAHGIKGPLFSVDYYGAESLNFRRHNSTLMARYAVKPKYQPGTKDTLPYCPVIYLGLSRLVPFGEFQNDEALSSIKRSCLRNIRMKLHRCIKRLQITIFRLTLLNKWVILRFRSEFTSNIEGLTLILYLLEKTT